MDYKIYEILQASILQKWMSTLGAVKSQTWLSNFHFHYFALLKLNGNDMPIAVLWRELNDMWYARCLKKPVIQLMKAYTNSEGMNTYTEGQNLGPSMLLLQETE